MIQRLFGWNTIDDLAWDTWHSIHSCLMYGDFEFAVREGDYQIIISKRKDLKDVWMIGTKTPGWTSFQPRVPMEQLISQVPEDMKSFKFNKIVITSFLELFKQ